MVTDKQVKKLFKLRSMGMTQEESANKTNMDVKTARKYLMKRKLPGQLKVEHTWNTRKDPFEDVWGLVKDMLKNNHGLESKTIFDYLQRENPGKFQDGQLRTLQRKIKDWRATGGPPKEVYFDQIHYPGQLCQSDFTDMNKLGISIGGIQFKHILYHFVLTYSNWETGTICFSESFESLSNGFQNALWELGGVPREHRTDRLSAAVNNRCDYKEFTEKYKQLLEHYRIKGQKTQAESPHENGDVEQRHHRLKRAIDQALMLRGSRDFSSREKYEEFLKKIFEQLNSNRTERLKEEMKVIRELPDKRIEDYKELKAKVTKNSTIRVSHNTYSVPSQLIGEYVRIKLYAENLKVLYNHKVMEEMPRLRGESNHFVQYRHIIDSLIRKPGAFENYRYKSSLFPSSYFRMAYDILRASESPLSANKKYLKILYLAAKESEDLVENALRMIIDSGIEIRIEDIEKFIKSKNNYEIQDSVTIPEVDLTIFDQLLDGTGVVQ